MMDTLSPSLILVVDDRPENACLLFNCLTQHGFEVLVAQDGASALHIAEMEHPHLVLLDVLMPGISGFETCQQLKANAILSDIPIIFTTALNGTVDKVKGFELGAVDYITKPFEPEELLARVRTHLTLYHLQQQLRAKELALQEANQKLHWLASLDELTQVANRRVFNERLQQEWQRLRREQLPLSLLMCDIDHFKRYNDNYGHLAGDNCLQQVAKAMGRAVKRPADLVARYGGEEFVVILPNTIAQGAVHVAHNIQHELENNSINSMGYLPNVQPITLSIGVSSMVPNGQYPPESLIQFADTALYEAKARGRNQVVLYAVASLEN